MVSAHSCRECPHYCECRRSEDGVGGCNAPCYWDCGCPDYPPPEDQAVTDDAP